MEQQYPPSFKRPPQDDENWIDDYAPKDAAENAYFHGLAPEPLTPRGGELPKRKKHSGTRWLAVLLVVVIGSGAWLLLTSHKTAAPAKPAKTSQAKTGGDNSAGASLPQHHESANFSLGISYPSDWKVDDTAEQLRVISPTEQLKVVGGKTVSGHAVVTIRPRQATLPEFAKGSAVAVWESTLVRYKNPTQNQRAQTYLSSLSYASSANGSFDAYYLTGDDGYQAGQEVPMSDVIQTDPLVTVVFEQCADDGCASGVAPLSLSADDAQENSLVTKLIPQILASLSIN